MRRRKAEKVLKEFQSQMTGKSVDKLEAQKRERVIKAEKRKEAFKKKQAEKTRSEQVQEMKGRPRRRRARVRQRWLKRQVLQGIRRARRRGS